MQLAFAIADPVIDIAELIEHVLHAFGQSVGRLASCAKRPIGDFVGKALADDVVAERLEGSDRHWRGLSDDASRPANHRELGFSLKNRPIAAVAPIIDQRQGQQRLAEPEGGVVDQKFERIDPRLARSRRVSLEIPLEEFATASFAGPRHFKMFVCLIHTFILPANRDWSETEFLRA